MLYQQMMLHHTMALWRLAPASLLAASASSFVLPPASTSEHVASRTGPATRGSCGHDLCGPRAVGPTAAPPSAATTPRRSGTLAHHRATIGRLCAGSGENAEVGVDDTQGWDGTEAGMAQDAAAATATGREHDDGFASLDDLLGVDDNPASPTAPYATGEIGSGGGVNIDPFGEPDAAVTDSSLDDLLSELQPPPAAGGMAAPSTPGGTRASAKPRDPPALSEGRLSSSWLDDLLDLENEDLYISPSPGAAAAEAAASRGLSTSSPASGILESVIDDVTGAGDRDGPRAPAGGIGGPRGGGTTAPAPAPADTTAALDDWLNELLDDGGGSGQGGASRSKPAATSAPPAAVAAEAETTAAAASREDDGWVLAGEGYGRSGGDFGDVITGSNQLEGWKANTLNTDAPKRSNVMGRATRRTDAGSGPTQQKSRPWEQGSGEDHGRSSEWGAGDSWTDKGGRGGPSWWDEDSPGLGMEETTGRRFDAAKKERKLDPIQAAQRACTADLKKLGRRGQWEDATKALVGAKVRGIPLDAYMYNSAISAVGKAGRWKEALSMMKQMEKDGVAFNHFTYTSVIAACGRGGKPRKALELLDEMVNVHGIVPDVVCYGAAIQACGDAGMSEEALSLMRRMSGDGLLPDKAAYNSAIIACCEKGQWEQALELLGEMRSAGLKPDQNSYRFAMKACGVGGRWERAMLLLHEMEEDGSTPDTAAFQAVLDTLRDAAQWEKAMELISEMDELGVPPTEECFSAAIAACAEVGEWRQAAKARKQMGSYGLQPEIETYKSIIRACLVAKEFDMALTTLFDIQTSGRRPDQETWDMLVEICAQAGKWDAALEIIRDIFAEEVWFDMTTIRSRFFDCPSEDIRMKALKVIAMEATTAPTMKRRKINNMRAAAKRKPGYRPPEKALSARERKRKEKSDSDASFFADSNFE